MSKHCETDFVPPLDADECAGILGDHNVDAAEAATRKLYVVAKALGGGVAFRAAGQVQADNLATLIMAMSATPAAAIELADHWAGDIKRIVAKMAEIKGKQG